MQAFDEIYGTKKAPNHTYHVAELQIEAAGSILSTSWNTSWQYQQLIKLRDATSEVKVNWLFDYGCLYAQLLQSLPIERQSFDYNSSTTVSECVSQMLHFSPSQLGKYVRTRIEVARMLSMCFTMSLSLLVIQLSFQRINLIGEKRTWCKLHAVFTHSEIITLVC